MICPPPRRFPRSCASALTLVAALWASTARSQTDAQTFSRGSLIIPMQSSFQTACGVVSAYGLVWRILQSNQPGHFNANHPVSVYWVINPSKASPNRCVPTNLTSAPSPSQSGPSGAGNHWDDVRWNDGCDFAIVDPTQMPVVPVDYRLTFPASGVYPLGALALNDTTGVGSPAFGGMSVDNTGSGDSRFTTVQYSGGPFVINAADAPNVINFLKNGDGLVPTSQLPFTDTGCTCPAGGVPSPSCHFVAMHQATVEFQATVARRMDGVPPKIALLDSGAGVAFCTSGSDCADKPRVLVTYLQNAGLYYLDDANHNSAGGCPEGSHSDCGLNSSVKGPSGQKFPGLIYDEFNAWTDLISTHDNPFGLLNRTDASGQPIYRVFWTPHWETNSVIDFSTGHTISGPEIVSADPSTGPIYSTYQSNNDGATSQRENALNNVAFFLGGKGTGMMAECASTSSFEGDPRIPRYSARTQFLFNTFDVNEAPSPFEGKNCTDPDYASGDCMLYPNPTNPFAQIGDWHFIASTGFTANFGSHVANGYRPGVAQLGVTWHDFRPGDFPSDTDADFRNGWDIFDMGLKDNDSNQAAIVYIGGHEYTQSTVGHRMVLNTLLNLGVAPAGTERALTAPIAFEDPNGTDAAGNHDITLAATYNAIAGYPAGADTFNPSRGSRWVFPTTPGHLRAHSVVGGAALSTSENNLDTATLWDAAETDNASGHVRRMPLPGARNVFTYLGGQTLAGSDLAAALPRGDSAPHGVRQVGWLPEQVAGTALDSNARGCVDVLQFGQTPDQTFGLVPGSDGVCDLQEALEFTAVNAGSDFGASNRSANLQALQNGLPAAQQLLQVVRGFCFATSTGNDGSGDPILEPADGQCNSSTATNRSMLGGLVHSTPALVPASPIIDGALTARPTVVYAGGYDGQLHAFYVSGGAGYAGPGTALNRPNPSAASSRPGGDPVFRTDWSTQFQSGNVPVAGTELWSFIPASQLPLLQNNNARVDASPAVMDAFVDVDGSGVRQWHTILVGSVGATGSEVFALDISNPLKPVLLWDVVGNLVQASANNPAYTPVVLADQQVGGAGAAFKWTESGPSAAFFRLPPATDPGRTNAALYDYSDLGGARGISLGQMRNGLNPLYAAFVASNAGPGSSVRKGLEVFAIDMATGQKLWQWEEPYTGADNTLPSPATVLVGPDGARRIYAGDMEGRLWELDALTGINVNNANGSPACSGNSPCNFAAFDGVSTADNPFPITTNVAIARVPTQVAPGSALAAFPGATVLTFGTGGADWVPRTVPGKLHVLLLDDKFRVPATTGGTHLDGSPWPQPEAFDAASATGVLQEVPGRFPVLLAPGEHLNGALTVSGQTLFFSSARGTVTDIRATSAEIRGATYSLDLGAAPVDNPINRFSGLSLASFGGPTVLHTASSGNFLIALEISKIAKVPLAGEAATPKAELSLRGFNLVLFQLRTWFLGFLFN